MLYIVFRRYENATYREEVFKEMLKFKGYCAENRIKQTEIAKLLGLTKQSVNNKINGRQDFTLSEVKTICLHYGISADLYFLSECCEKVTEES